MRICQRRLGRMLFKQGAVRLISLFIGLYLLMAMGFISIHSPMYTQQQEETEILNLIQRQERMHFANDSARKKLDWNRTDQAANYVVHPPHTSATQLGDKHNFLKNFKNPCWYNFSPKVSNLQCLPYFYVLGMAKSGTTTLYTCIAHHQDVASPREKELSYWRTDSKVPDIELYVPKFREAAHDIYKSTIEWTGFTDYHHKITYEGTPSYVWHLPYLPRVMYQVNPQTKLILTMRHPTDRLFSHYHHWCTRLNKAFTPEKFHKHVSGEIEKINDCTKTRSISACVVEIATDEISVGLSVYYVYIKAWLEVFPSDQMLIIKAEELYKHTTKVLDGVFKFLELRPPSAEAMRHIDAEMDDYVPPALEIWAKKNEIEGVDTLQNKYLQRKGNLNKDLLHEARGNWTSYRSSMLPQTKLLLDDFYAPYNNKLADLLKDDRFLYERT